MSTPVKVSVTATNKGVPNPIAKVNNTVVFGGGVDGTATAGTITLLAKAPHSTNFETPSSNVINIATPVHLNIVGKIEEYDVTVAGFAGTATQIFVVLDSF